MAEDTREHIEQPFGGLQKDVTGEDYEKALENLKRFSGKDISKITTLEELAFEMRFVGKGLQAVVVSSGEIQETKFNYQHPTNGEVKAVDRTYVIRKPVSGGTIFATSGEKQAYLDQYRIEGDSQLSNFTAIVPTDDEIRVSDDPFDNMLIASAVDWRGEKTVSYFPAKEPLNKNVLQGYARVVQDGVKNILAVTKPPTQVPFKLD
jgi:hypothetical protein